MIRKKFQLCQCMTNISMSYISQLEEEVQRFHEENQQLKDAHDEEQVTEKTFKTFPSDKIRCFTGLPILMRLMAVFSFVQASVA